MLQMHAGLQGLQPPSLLLQSKFVSGWTECEEVELATRHPCCNVFAAANVSRLMVTHNSSKRSRNDMQLT